MKAQNIKVTVTFKPLRAEINKVTKKLATDQAIREVNRAVNAWLYSR